MESKVMFKILKNKVMEMSIIVKYVTRILRYQNEHNAQYFVLLLLSEFKRNCSSNFKLIYIHVKSSLAQKSLSTIFFWKEEITTHQKLMSFKITNHDYIEGITREFKACLMLISF